MTPLVRETLERLAASKARPEQYVVFIDFARLATPTDVEELNRHDLPDTFGRQFEILYDRVERAYPGHRGFQLVPLHSSAFLYSAPTTGRKNLVIAFCGKGQSLMMPVALFLQFFSEQDFDVVVLRDFPPSGFTEGIADFGESVRSVLSRLDRTIGFARYRSVRTVGTSGGGVASLAAGLILDAASACCVSGHLPSTSSRYAGSAGAIALEEVLTTTQSECRLHCVFGAKNPVDKREAEAISKIRPVTLVPIDGCHDHTVLFYLFENGRLTSFLDQVRLTKLTNAVGGDPEMAWRGKD